MVHFNISPCVTAFNSLNVWFCLTLFTIYRTPDAQAAPVTLLVMIHINFLHSTPQKHTSDSYQAKLVLLLGVFESVKNMISHCVAQKRMFCPYRRTEMKQRHDEIRKKYGELSLTC